LRGGNGAKVVNTAVTDLYCLSYRLLYKASQEEQKKENTNQRIIVMQDNTSYG